MSVISGYTHPVRRTFALSLLSTAMFAGQALSTPFVGLVETLMGTNTALLFGIMASCTFVLFLGVLGYLLFTRKTIQPAPYADVAELSAQ
jgi:hypothetical protein